MITYTIAMLRPHTHLFDLTVEVPDGAGPELDLTLPAWTPGSYMVREYARHVQEFSAVDGEGRPLAWRKVAKDTWRVAAGGGPVVARYRVYANELTVRTSHLDGSHGYFNGACVFMFSPGRTAEPLAVNVVVPSGWQVATGMEPAGPPAPVEGGTRFPFAVADYDELVDCPAECGTHRLLSFEVDGIPHRIAIWGQGNDDEARLVADTRRIVEAQRDMFGGLPYRHYTFILHLTDGKGGGLEHRNSVSNMVDRWTFQPERSYERYLSLTSHELFHVWNVKRIRPETLGPFDYRGENYTRMLWAMEGITSYYDELLLVRAGLLKPQRYLEKLGDEIQTLQSQPGRRLQSLEASSFDAWIKFYRPDENSANTSISYYLKGALVSLLLDMHIRALTANERSLDDVQRHLFARYPISGPGIPEDGGYLAAIEEVVGEHGSVFRDFYARYIAGTDELDYAAGLAHAGLRLEWGWRSPRPGRQAPAWLGLTFRRHGERTLVAAARSDGPAYAAGIYADDELVALDGWRVDEGRLNARLAERAPGDPVRLTLFRGDALIEVRLELAAAPHDQLTITRHEGATELQKQIYESWLGL